MNTLYYTRPFAPVHIGIRLCFCGKPTVEDHDFCFCSPQCARADAMRALGEDDCHYRQVMRGAYANSGAPEPAIYRHKSENQLRNASIARRVPGMSQGLRHPPKPTHEKTLPTLEEATSSRDRRVHDTRRPFESRNEGVGLIAAEPSAPPQRTLKRSLPSRAGLSNGVRGSVLAMFRNKNQQTAPLNVKKKAPVINRESSVTAAVLRDMEEENEEEAALWKLLNSTEDRSPTAYPQARPITATRRSGGIRRSASFAGWNDQIENRKPFEKDRGSVMQSVFQLRKMWQETPDPMPNFDEESDEEY
ncbi:uncharacterized protein EDB91DRAFT_675379 [Suillus paluster]|uniref:uncharacterized protein n=1 Tax=Suillus paluster TaxID=48578 RepID=UPI001B882515|nr:uncharacterized protein EDB91DRAFT_675379 [Suillus paluster]KAG1732454.1 hypothetical protein EDB91DRAFT_675379 [Suillus paluster]